MNCSNCNVLQNKIDELEEQLLQIKNQFNLDEDAFNILKIKRYYKISYTKASIIFNLYKEAKPISLNILYKMFCKYDSDITTIKVQICNINRVLQAHNNHLNKAILCDYVRFNHDLTYYRLNKEYFPIIERIINA